MARLTKYRWSKNWYIVWSEGRRSCRLSTKTGNKARAQRALARFEAVEAAPPEELTCNDIFDGWFGERSERKWAKNIGYSLRPLRLGFGVLAPSDITRLTVRGYIGRRRQAGAKPSTIDRDLRILRACLNWARREKWIKSVPYIGTPGGSAPRERWLSNEDADALLAGAYSHHIRLFILCALFSGARTSSILDLTWDRVSLGRRVLVFPPSDPGSRKRTSVVPINETLAVALAEARRGATSDWVIEHNGKPVKSIKTGFRAAVRRAGIEHCTPHDLRRTCATWMIQAGIPTAKVARYLGDTEKMIENVYGHHAPDYLRDAAEALDAARNLRANSRSRRL